MFTALYDPSITQIPDKETDELLQQLSAVESDFETLPASAKSATSLSKSTGPNNHKSTRSKPSTTPAPADADDDADTPLDEFRAYLEILTPAHHVEKRTPRNNKVKTIKVKQDACRSPMFALPRSVDASEAREVFAKLVGVKEKRFALSRASWRFFTAGAASLRSLGSVEAFDNLRHHLSLAKNRDKEVVFVYTRAIKSNGTPEKVQFNSGSSFTC